MGKRTLLGVLPVVLLLAACGEEADPGSATVPPAADASAGESPADASPSGEPELYQASGTVLEAAGQGPRLCYSVMESYPPQCGGGLEIVGWDWAALEAESSGDITWGSYAVTGRWDGERFEVTEVGPPREPDPGDGAPEPEGEPSGRDLAELLAVQEELSEDFPEVLAAYPDEELGVVRADVVAESPELRESLEQRFGAGAVVLNGWLRPVPPEG